MISRLTRHAGYSLIELISVLVIIGIMAAFAVPRMVDQTGFAARGFYDKARALIAYAQKIAIAQRRAPAAPIYVVVASNKISVCNDAVCNTPLTEANGGGPLALDAPSGVTVAPVTTFNFSGSGAPSAAVTLTVNSTGAGDAPRTLFVEAQTGYVHP